MQGIYVSKFIINKFYFHYLYAFDLKCSYVILKSEENLVKITNLYLGSDLGEGDMITFDERPENPILSLTVIKTTGRDAPSHYGSKYASLTLPYWETLQDHIGNARIAINVNIAFQFYNACILKQKVYSLYTLILFYAKHGFYFRFCLTTQILTNFLIWKTLVPL